MAAVCFPADAGIFHRRSAGALLLCGASVSAPPSDRRAGQIPELGVPCGAGDRFSVAGGPLHHPVESGTDHRGNAFFQRVIF